MAARAAETVIDTLSRARWPVLIVFAVATIIAILELPRNSSPQIEMAVRISLALAGVTVIAFVHLRHFWLAVLAAFAPLPGLLVVIAVTGDVSLAETNYALGLIVALFAADAFAVRTVEGAQSDAAMRGAFEDIGAAAVAVFAVAFLSPVILHWTFSEIPRSMFGAAASVLAAGLIVPLSASVLRYGENFAASFNRLREIEERAVMPMLAVAHPRWGASIAGVGIVLCALGYFGAAGPHIPGGWRLALFSAALCAGAAFWVSRDWRRSAAVVLSLMPAVLAALWASNHLHVQLSELSIDHLALVLLGGFVLLLLVASKAAQYARSGNDTGLASARAMERMSGIVLAATLASVLAITAGTSDPTVPIVALVLSAVAAILFQPAVTISIETLFPRRETIAARYRVR